MIAMLASGVTVGVAGAAMVWSDGHHPLAILLAYTLTGMIGMLGTAAFVSGQGIPEDDACL